MNSLYHVIKKPIVTEKASALKAEANKVVFAVDRRANKLDVKKAIESLFEVKVTDVQTMVFRGKHKRVGSSQGMRQNWKKAVVTLAEGTDLDVFGTMPTGEAPPQPAEQG
ncbi:MAG: 50S ribosomal protein L23 [Deltaproteobacteria bacterium]|nr:50S ribosomal protein L23 [Deltaproteobacteria bacterium]